MSNARKATAKKAAPKKMGLQAALAQKKVRRSHYDVPLAESEVADEISGRIRRLTNAIDVIRMQEDNEAALEKAQEQLADAKQELRKCFHRLEFKGLPDDEYDALLSEHPPTDEQVAHAKKNKYPTPAFDKDAFIPALLERCYVGDDGMSAEAWKEELATWGWAERGDLTNRVIEANTRPFSDGLPKD